jgi:hypothetical protein
MIERVMLGAAIAALISALYLTAPEISEVERQHKRYCDMVDAWQDSDGEYGWPPYRENVTCED